MMNIWKIIRNQNIIIGIILALLVVMEPLLGIQPANPTEGELFQKFAITFVIANVISLVATLAFRRVQGRGNGVGS